MTRYCRCKGSSGEETPTGREASGKKMVKITGHQSILQYTLCNRRGFTALFQEGKRRI